jgi:hypothetical protein
LISPNVSSWRKSYGNTNDGDAMRYLDANGKIGWKASPRFLTMLADAERDAQDDLEDFP